MRRLTFLLAAAAVIAACERTERETEMPAVEATRAAVTFDGADYADDASKLAHGKRLARVLDCTGCHGDNLQGQNVTDDDPAYGDMYAPNLTLLMAEYSDSDLEKLLRTGTPKDGGDLWFMPAESYQFLSDRDLAAITAFLRSHPPAGKQLPPIRKGEKMRKEIAAGLYSHAAAQTVKFRDNPPADLGPKHERGRQLARIVCTGCHNGELQGMKGFTPDLDVAGAYTSAELKTLLTTGKGKSKPDLGLMTIVARYSFSQLTPGERKAIADYVLARANREQPPQ